MHDKENSSVGVTSSQILGAVGGSYLERLKRRQELQKLSESVAGKSVAGRLMQKSISLKKNISHQALENYQTPKHSHTPLSTIPANEALLDAAADQLQRELEGYDKKLQMLKTHIGPLPAVPLPPQAKNAAAAPQPQQAPPAEESIVRAVITATGVGCKEVISESIKYNNSSSRRGSGSPGAIWKTHAHKAPKTTSSCMLQLAAKRHKDVSIRITFTDPESVPAVLCIEHAPTPTAAFVMLGQIPLQAKSMKQLKHVFRLGADSIIDRCLRISCRGNIASKHAGIHCVSYLSVTGEVVETPSPPPVPAGFASVRGSGTGLPEGHAPLEAEASFLPEEIEFNVSIASSKPIEDAHEMLKKEEASIRAAAEPKKKGAPPPPPPPLPSAALKRRAAPPPPPPLPPSRAAPAAAITSAAPSGGPSPTKPTLKLFWDKVQPRQSTIHKTVWGQLPESEEVEVDFTELEDEFAAKAPAVTLKGKSAAARRNIPVGPRFVTMQRANNIGAMLARLKLSPEQAKRALLCVLGDESTEADSTNMKLLGVEELESIVPCLPTDDERQRMAEFQGSWEGLIPCERFMLSILHVPALKERLQAMIFLHGFNDRAAAVAAAASSVTAACAEIKESSLLRSVLKTALAIGNFLNSGNRNGSAAGFQVDALLKLRDVRSTRTRSRTLLHFLARELKRKYPESDCSLTSELPTCRDASRIALADLRSELDSLAEGIEAAHKAGKDGGADTVELDELLADATESLAEVNGAVVEADAAFMELRVFLNGKPATMEEPSAFFSLMATFCSQLDAAHAENATADGKSQAYIASKRPSSAPCSLGSGASATRPRQQHTKRASVPAQVAEESTPPLQRRDRVLATIRAYSKLTASERKTLLTEKGAKERLKNLDISQRHSINVPTANDAAASKATEKSSKKSVAASVRGSAPVISLAALLASATELTPEGKVSPLPPVVEVEETEEQQQQTEPLSETVAEVSQSVAPLVEEEKEEDHADGAAVDQSLATTVEEEEEPEAAISSPVARMIASSKNLVQSVALRCSALDALPAPAPEIAEAAEEEEIQDAQEEIEEPPAHVQEEEEEIGTEPPIEQFCPPAAAAAPSPALTPRSDDAHSDVSLSSPRDAAELVDPTAPEEESSSPSASVSVPEAQDVESPPVTLRPLKASFDTTENDEDVCQPTPQLAWGRRSSRTAAPKVQEESQVPASASFDKDTLECTATLQPVFGAASNVWETRCESLMPESSPGLSEENPMGSTNVAHDGFAEHGYNEYDAHHSGGSAAGAAAVAFNELRSSTEWVPRSNGHLQHGQQKSSKRVSFSLPTSPVEWEAEDEPQPLQQQEHWSEDELEAENGGFVESPCGLQGLSPIPEQEEAAAATNAPGAISSRSSKRQPISVPGLDLNLAKQLVKNASNVRKSLEHRNQSAAAAVSEGLAIPAGSHSRMEGTSLIGGSTPDLQGLDRSLAIAPSTATSEGAAASVQDQAAAILQKALASQLRASLPRLPGVSPQDLPAIPLALSPINLDQIMATIIANAGNTPTGPLARGIRQGDLELFNYAEAEILRAEAARRAAAVAEARPGQQHKALLEPILPAPLGMGVRASETVADGISPSTLRDSLTAHMQQLRQAHSYIDSLPATEAATAAAGGEEDEEVQGVEAVPGGFGSVYGDQDTAVIDAQEEPLGYTPQQYSYQGTEEGRAVTVPYYDEGYSYDQVYEQGGEASSGYQQQSYGNYYCSNENAGPMGSAAAAAGSGYKPTYYNTNGQYYQSYGSGMYSGSEQQPSARQQSRGKRSSHREVHSALAQERIARWGSYQTGSMA